MLYQSRQFTLSSSPAERLSTLPVPVTPPIAREAEIETVGKLLTQPGVRLLTLTGPAGVGETRLGLAVTARLLDAFRDGIVFVPLQSIIDPDLLPTTIAQAIDVRENGGRPIVERLIEVLHDRQLLLFLDNFEQILDAASYLGKLVETCPGLTILVTSRAVLDLYGEHNYSVPPLEVPTHVQGLLPEQVEDYAAVQLFVARAQAVSAGLRSHRRTRAPSPRSAPGSMASRWQSSWLQRAPECSRLGPC